MHLLLQSFPRPRYRPGQEYVPLKLARACHVTSRINPQALRIINCTKYWQSPTIDGVNIRAGGIGPNLAVGDVTCYLRVLFLVLVGAILLNNY